MTRVTALTVLLLALLSAATSIAAVPPPQDTVKVGNETQVTVGVVTDLVAGDVACYLTLRDDRGHELQELADFALCERTDLVGKRVRLTYTPSSVLADECQGNPDCRKSKTVALVTAAQVLAERPAAATAGRRGFCAPSETVVFACPIGAKEVSVCASPGASRTRGALHYRFGKLSAPGGPEITLPAGEVVPGKAASGGSLMFSGGGAAWLRFRKGDFSYSVYTGIGKWGPDGEPVEKEGVVVEKADKVVASLRCTGRATSLLGLDWFESMGVEENGVGFEIPE